MDILSFDNLVTLALLTLLQGVLGFDNLLYVALESKRAPVRRQASIRRWGIGIAIVLRIVLLFALTSMIGYFQEPIIGLHNIGLVEGQFNVHSIIVLLGGAFIIYTSTREILHMTVVDDLEHEERGARPIHTILLWIVAMNLVFSFDSILSAMALTDVFWVMATAIVIGGVMMIWLADSVAEFLQRNRMYEVLGLFILFVVGIMLLSEGGHLAHLRLLGNKVTPMSKTTFYFVIGVLVLTDVAQSRYQKRLLGSGAHSA